MNQIEDEIVNAMARHGFTKTEARAYVALLKAHPATGYELAARSGVPRSAIYNVLRKLSASGAIRAVSEQPKRYSPIAPAQLLKMVEARMSQGLASLEKSLNQLRSGVPEATTWVLSGYDAILERAQAMVAAAESSVHLSVWAREAETLQPLLSEAEGRGVSIVAFSFSKLPPLAGRSLTYGLEEEALEGHWDHKLVLIVDQARVLVGTVNQSEDARAVETDETAVVDMAINNLVLDVTLYGERMEQDTAAVVRELANRFAPIDDLLERRVAE